MAQISYMNKVALETDPSIADINKITDNDMNEIKSVVNDNYNHTIQITDTEPVDNDCKLWINPDDVVVRQDNIVKTEYNESDDNTYSTNYINNAFGGKILYYDSTGVNSGNIQFSDNPLNYSKVAIYTYDGNRISETIVFPSENANFVVQFAEVGNAWMAIINKYGNLTSTGITITSSRQWSGEGYAADTGSKIYKVIGYK